MGDDLICVHRAHSISEADVCVAVLRAQGFHAYVKDRNAIAMGTISMFSSDPERGLIPVLVAGAESAAAAVDFLASRADLIIPHDDESDGREVEIECGACGEALWITRHDAGHVIECPHCGVEVELPAVSTPDDHEDHQD
ncbi:MAG: hypothetical protein ACYTHJ_10345 [Planctomycetota bacterium]